MYALQELTLAITRDGLGPRLLSQFVTRQHAPPGDGTTYLVPA